MHYKFPDYCPRDGGRYSTVQALAEHIFNAHIPSKCPRCRTAWTTDMIDSWVHTCYEHSVPEVEYFLRCEKCGAELTLIAHTYDERGDIVHFICPRE
jgi:phage FluMu protein Com